MKIETVLETIYGISSPMNIWLKLPQISIIYLDQDANIYLSDNQLFYFDTEEDSLLISEDNSYVNLETVETAKSSYPVHTKFTLGSIGGFISSSIMGPSGIYLKRRF